MRVCIASAVLSVAGIACAEDWDGDGYENENDSHIYDPNFWDDWNNDNISDAIDRDGDGYGNDQDSHPNNPHLYTDGDNDGWNEGDGTYGYYGDADYDWVPNYQDSHPWDPYRNNDWDNDYLQEDVEFNLGTSPTNADTDGDGLSDGAEYLTWHTDPTLADTDRDGFDDLAEIINGTNPLNPLDY